MLNIPHVSFNLLFASKNTNPKGDVFSDSPPKKVQHRIHHHHQHRRIPTTYNQTRDPGRPLRESRGNNTENTMGRFKPRGCQDPFGKVRNLPGDDLSRLFFGSVHTDFCWVGRFLVFFQPWSPLTSWKISVRWTLQKKRHPGCLRCKDLLVDIKACAKRYHKGTEVVLVKCQKATLVR